MYSASSLSESDCDWCRRSWIKATALSRFWFSFSTAAGRLSAILHN